MRKAEPGGGVTEEVGGPAEAASGRGVGGVVEDDGGQVILKGRERGEW